MRQPPSPDTKRRPSTTHTHLPTPDATPSPSDSPSIQTPHHPPRPRAVSSHSSFPPPPHLAIQKYSDELRKALSARFKAVAAAGKTAVVSPEAATDPDYGYDEDPFDTRARLLMSFGNDQGAGPSSTTTPPVPPLSTSNPSMPHHHAAVPMTEHVFDLTEDYELDYRAAPAPASPKRWSMASGVSEMSFGGASTPNSMWSEASFEVGGASDYMSVYGRPRSTATAASDVQQQYYRERVQRRNSVLGAIRSLAVATPSPQQQQQQQQQQQPGPAPTAPPPAARRLLRRPRPYDMSNSNSTSASASVNSTPPPFDGYADTIGLARTTSETMILAAGLAVQRSRPAARV